MTAVGGGILGYTNHCVHDTFIMLNIQGLKERKILLGCYWLLPHLPKLSSRQTPSYSSGLPSFSPFSSCHIHSFYHSYQGDIADGKNLIYVLNIDILYSHAWTLETVIFPSAWLYWAWLYCCHAHFVDQIRTRFVIPFCSELDYL